MAESRTAKSVKNAQVSFFYYVVFMILGFWSRKVFFDYLGSEVVGLESTAGNLLGFLNLAELGIGMSVTYFLYKPLFSKDYEEINKIVALQGWIYRRVAYLVIGGAVVLMCFFPQIFHGMKLPMWYAYAIFGAFLFNSLLGYFINYRRIVLNTDQKGYKVTRVTTGVGVVLKILLIVMLPIVPSPFLFYVGTTLFSTLFSCWWLNRTIDKEYPWLKATGYQGKKLLKDYPDVIKKTKQLFIHRITTVLLFQGTPFIMYAFSTLSVVAYYANYLLLVGKLKDVLSMVYSSMGAAVGSLIAEGDKEKIHRRFWELYDSRFCIAAVALICIYFLSHPFIALWLGEKYILGQFLLILLIVDQSIYITRLTVDHYINGYGIFRDVWAPMAEGAINITAALGFGFLIGYEGVILGSILSQVIIICIWKPILLFHDGLKSSVLVYFRRVIIRYVIIVFDVIGLTFLFDIILPHRFSSFLAFAIYGAMVFVIVSLVIFGEFLAFTQGTRDFFQRVWGVLHHKFK